ncbi:MAG: GNAT family N-acetyltransferase [Anaerolineae bacterium]|nr:GNAT family N-acetyltransferase [Anaerolineae bacterium]
MWTIRPAQLDDAPIIAALHDTVWPSEQIAITTIESALAQPERLTLLAVDSHRSIGYVDAFTTIAENGSVRWEIDLLAVHPHCQRIGVGSGLIDAILKSAQGELARAVIAHGNLGAENAFARFGFAPSAPQRLWIAESQPDPDQKPPLNAHLIPIQTLTYRGLWIEGVLSAQALSTARALTPQIAGVLIPEADTTLSEDAHQLGYRLIGRYRFWCKTLN